MCWRERSPIPWPRYSASLVVERNRGVCRRIRRHPPDRQGPTSGYTLAWRHRTLAIDPTLYPNERLHPRKDFAYRPDCAPAHCLVNQSVAAHTVQELIALKSQPEA
jgi:hypothetical protein